MERIKTLLETYAAADADQRLSMFLTYRDLRRPFTQIDMAPGRFAQPVSLKQKRLLTGWLRWPRMATHCRGWLKHVRVMK